VIEETFVLKCTPDEWVEFLGRSKKHADGWIGFYWGATRKELRASREIGDAIMESWLEIFQGPARP
jgi:hypothetical protein